MHAFLAPAQSAHAPQTFLHQGVLKPSPEAPERIAILKDAAQAEGCTFAAPPDAGIAPIAAVHSSEYIGFLRTIHARWSALDGAAPEVIPNIHPRSRADSYPTSPVGQAGYHQADTACPIGPHTWEAAYASAQSAIAAADAVASGAPHAYALCRPPGHHAYADQAGGFCFLNNSAVAAQRLLAAGHRPAILDIDVHHGNGTQGIFYDRADVLTVSIHADPSDFYPFFWGHAQERGAGAGLGANLNLPLPRLTDDDGYAPVLDTALARITDFGTTALVVALGLDAHQADPFKGLALTTPGFTRIARTLAATGLPLVLVQEGGYVSNHLGTALSAFLSGL